MVGAISQNENGETVTTPDTFSPVFEESGLSGAVFDIIAVSDIYYPNGEIRVKSGTVVDTVTTDENGEAVSKELFLGDYKLMEKKAPNGYVIDKSEYLVSLTYAGQEVEITSTLTEAYNTYQKAEITVPKVMESAEDFGIDAKDYRQYVTFGLYANEDITAADGKVIPKDGLVEQITLSDNMTAKFNKAIPFGKYYVKEMTTDEHYMISDEKHEFEFAYAGQEIPTVKVDAGEFVNDLKRGKISGVKVDADDKKSIEGAEIGLFMGDDKEFSKAVMTTKSAKNGSFSFDNIPYGVYQIKEIKAPTGYKMTDKVFPVTISENGQIVEIQIENEIIHGNVEVKKFDKETDKKLTGAIFTLYKDTDSDGKYNATADIKYGTLAETDGVHTLKNIPYGDYLLTETKAPTSYVLDTKFYSVKIREDGKTLTISNDKSKDKFYNKPIKGKVIVNKYDSETDKKLSGAEFMVYVGNTDEEYGKLIEKGGVYSLGNIPMGSYSLMETVAPEGYYLDGNRYPFVIKTDGEKIVITNSDSKDRFNNVKITTTTTTSTTTTTTTTTTSTSETTPEETTAETTTVTTLTTSETTPVTTETSVTTTSTEVTTTTTETSTEVTTIVTPVITTISETVPFKESAPKTGDTGHTIAVVASVLGLLALTGMIVSRKRN